MRIWLTLTIAVFSLLTVSTRALAQDDEPEGDHGFGEGYFAAKLLLGLGGEANYDAGPTDTDDDMELTYGVGVAYMQPLLAIFALGGQVSLASWNTETAADNDIDRNLYLDLSLLPQLNFDVSSVELYVMMPLGFTLDFVGEDDAFAGGSAASASVSTDVGTGFHIGGLVGARFAVTRGFGLLAELGYVVHSFSHEVDTTVMVLGAGGTTTADYDVSIGQFVLNLGIYL